MKSQFLIVICCLITLAYCEEGNTGIKGLKAIKDIKDTKDVDIVSTTSTTTESDPLISSLENIVNRVKSMKERVEKTLNETASTDLLEKSHHDFLIARGYTFTFGVGYHKLYLTELTWKEALHQCLQEKAHLAVIDSVPERKALGDLMKNRLEILQGVENLKAYVGIHDYCKNGSWITIFFDILDNAKHIQWREDYGGYVKGSTGPSCAVIDEEEYLSVVKCNKRQPFICEIESP